MANFEDFLQQISSRFYVRRPATRGSQRETTSKIIFHRVALQICRCRSTWMLFRPPLPQPPKPRWSLSPKVRKPAFAACGTATRGQLVQLVVHLSGRPPNHASCVTGPSQGRSTPRAVFRADGDTHPEKSTTLYIIL